MLVAAHLACQTPGDRDAEERYALRVTETLTRFAKSYAIYSLECERGALECAVAAQDGADAARKARSELAVLMPPEKLRGANERLVVGFDHLAQAYDIIADTYWDRSDVNAASMRSLQSIEKGVNEIAAAALLIGFKGDSTIWGAKR